jgi:hypothetical protein
MAKPPSEDDVLRKMLKTPPKPFTPKKGENATQPNATKEAKPAISGKK